MDNPKVIPLDSDLARKMAQVEARKEFLTKSYAARRADLFPDTRVDWFDSWGIWAWLGFCAAIVVAFVWYFADKI